MSDQEVVLSDDVQAQISKLDGLGDLLQKYMRPAMQQSVSLLAGAVEPNIPTLTGYARETFGTHVLNGSGLNMTGYVGWKGSPTAWWMNIVESGARPHPLVPGFTSRRGPGKAGWAGMQKLGVTPLGEHVKIGNTWVTMHTHPGFAGRFLLSNALDENQDAVDSIFSQAADDMLGEVSIND
jgi:hypothetical protein